MRVITEGKELDDNIATQAMKLVMLQKPHLQIQPTSISSIPDLLQYSDDDTIYIHHNGARHFTTSTSMGGKVRTYDSLNLTPTTNLLQQITAIYAPNNNSNHPRIQQMIHTRIKHKQKGSVDCGVFAIAYAVDLAFGEDPRDIANIAYSQSCMREHLAAALSSGTITQFPRRRNLNSIMKSSLRIVERDPDKNDTEERRGEEGTTNDQRDVGGGM